MQQMLSRTVTVGKNYALHIVTVYLFGLCTFLALFILAIGYNWTAFVWIAGIIVFWCVAGISVAFYALSQIDHAVQQIKDDMRAQVRKLNEKTSQLRRDRGWFNGV